MFKNRYVNKYIEKSHVARVVTYRWIVLFPQLRDMVGHVIIRDRDFFRDQFDVGKFHGVRPQFLQFLHGLPAGVYHVRVEWAEAGHQDRAFEIAAHFAHVKFGSRDDTCEPDGRSISLLAI